jgi:hypothetical protein
VVSAQTTTWIENGSRGPFSSRPARPRIAAIDGTRKHQIRLLLIAVPQLLHDLIVAMAANEDIDFVGEPARGESVLEALARTSADVVVVGVDDGVLAHSVQGYLDGARAVRVVTLRDAARRGAYYDVQPTVIDEFSRESLLAAFGTSA